VGNEASNDDQSNARKLAELITEAKFAMVTTQCEDGSLRSRPLTALDTRFDGVIWFIVQADSEVAREIEASTKVNVAYANADEGKFVAVSGSGQVMQDSAKAAELWNPAFEVWFAGPDDPNLAILRVVAEEADYWDSPSTRVGRLVGFVKALASGDGSALGQRQRLHLGEPRNAGNPATTNVYGEGNYAASREYNDATRQFVQAGRVEDAAEAAAPAHAHEAADLERAEEIGKRRAKEEDPQVVRRRSSKRN
jgi:general stress protein 26